MLLSITTTHEPATDLGFLLYKHPERFQSFDLSWGQAHVFYSGACEERCTACMLLDVDPVRLVRAETEIPLEATLSVLPCRGGEDFLPGLFEPLGYEVEATRHELDSEHPEWGESRYFQVTLRGEKRLADLLSHLSSSSALGTRSQAGASTRSRSLNSNRARCIA